MLSDSLKILMKDTRKNAIDIQILQKVLDNKIEDFTVMSSAEKQYTALVSKELSSLYLIQEAAKPDDKSSPKKNVNRFRCFPNQSISLSVYSSNYRKI